MRGKFDAVELSDHPYGHSEKRDADQAISQGRTGGCGSVGGSRSFGLYTLAISAGQRDTTAKASAMAAINPP
jgi:hypothetical protein